MGFYPRVSAQGFFASVFVSGLVCASLLSINSGVKAEVMPPHTKSQEIKSQNNFAPLIKGAPKATLSWSDVRKAHNVALSELRSQLKPADEYATLYAIQVALVRVGDGQTYVWGRPKRKLRALITPTSSYRASNGDICRKLKVSLSLGRYFKRIKTTACRTKNHSWKLQS